MSLGLADLNRNATTNSDADLLQRFVATFDRLDELTYISDEPLSALLATESEPPKSQFSAWRPAEYETPDSALAVIRRGGALPSLFESLATSYRWLAVDLGVCRMLPNEPADDLQPLANAMYGDPVMNNTLLPAGYIRFALAPNECYDPICFDLSRMVDDDCPIVRMNHESISMNDTVGEITTVFGSFRNLVFAVIESVN